MIWRGEGEKIAAGLETPFLQLIEGERFVPLRNDSGAGGTGNLSLCGLRTTKGGTASLRARSNQ